MKRNLTSGDTLSKLIDIPIYIGLIVLTTVVAIIPNAVAYGWAWDGPLAGWDFILAVVGFLVIGLMMALSLVWAIIRPKKPVWLFRFRFAAVPTFFVLYLLVLTFFGGTDASRGRGLVDRLDRVTPLDSLQSWAIKSISAGQPISIDSLPPEVKQTLPPLAQVSVYDDFLVISWYNIFIHVGPPDYEIEPLGETFFLEKVQPGIWVDIQIK